MSSQKKDDSDLKRSLDYDLTADNKENNATKKIKTESSFSSSEKRNDSPTTPKFRTDDIEDDDEDSCYLKKRKSLRVLDENKCDEENKDLILKKRREKGEETDEEEEDEQDRQVEDEESDDDDDDDSDGSEDDDSEESFHESEYDEDSETEVIESDASNRDVMDLEEIGGGKDQRNELNSLFKDTDDWGMSIHRDKIQKALKVEPSPSKKQSQSSSLKNDMVEETKQSSQSCPICLSEITGVTAKLDCCTHVFCFSCIEDWSKVTNQCPLCKERFRRLMKFSQDGAKIGELRVKFKVQEVDEPEYELIEDADEACYSCQVQGDMTKLLVCDRCGFYCCHTYCCSPPLHRVPLDPWYCGFCAQDMDLPQQTTSASSNRARSRTNNTNTNQNNSANRRSTASTSRNNSNLNRGDSVVAQSIRRALGEDSLLLDLFRESERLAKKGLKRSATRSKSTRKKTTKKSKKTKKTKTAKKSTKRSSSRKSTNKKKTAKK